MKFVHWIPGHPEGGSTDSDRNDYIKRFWLELTMVVLGKDDGAKLGTFICKMILLKYTSLWIDPSFDSITRDGSDIDRKWQKLHAICLLPVGKSVNISGIPNYAVKTKTLLGSINNKVYFCNIILKTNVPSFAPSSCLIDQHYERQSEFFSIVANVRIGWTSFTVLGENCDSKWDKPNIYIAGNAIRPALDLSFNNVWNGIAFGL